MFSRKAAMIIAINASGFHVSTTVQPGEMPVMKKAFIGFLFACSVILVGCSSPETASTTTPSPTVAPVAATPAPTAAPVDYAASVTKAKEDVEKALTEYKAKNYAGAVESLESAHKGLVAISANAPAMLKSGLETAGKGIESAKAMVEKKDSKVGTTLSNLVTSLTSLASTAKGAGGVADAAGSMMKSAAGAAGDAAGSMMKSAKEATEKK
jgi:hypothetical protein